MGKFFFRLHLALFFFLFVTLIPLTFFAQQANKPVTGSIPAASSVETLPAGFPANGKVNYIRTTVPMRAYSNPTDFNTAGYQNVSVSTEYSDGLGRPLQTVLHQAGPGSSPRDMISIYSYDNLGREKMKYLPYPQPAQAVIYGSFRSDAYTEQQSFYSTFNQLAGEQVFYTRNEYEPSSLNRMAKTFAPGNSWGGSFTSASEKATGYKYMLNTLADDVKQWQISNNTLNFDATSDAAVNIPVASSNPYPAGSLTKNVIINEDGFATVSYTDKMGRLILKKIQSGAVPGDYSGYTNFLCTYYVYDDNGRLRFVISPKAVDSIRPGWSLTGGVVNELCFRYEFDEYGRNVAKKVAGAGWLYMVYDSRDRVVFSQDANMRPKNQWAVSLYDMMNREVITGIMTYNGSVSALQSSTFDQTKPPVNPNTDVLVDKVLLSPNTSGTHTALRSVTLENGFESTSGGTFVAEITGGLGGFDGETSVLNGIAIHKNPLPPGVNFTPLTLKYYDNYDWTPLVYRSDWNGTLNDLSNPQSDLLPASASIQINGLQTGQKIRAIENPNNLEAGKWFSAVNFYSDKGRLIQVQQELYGGGELIATTAYDFSGKVLSSYQVYAVADLPQTRVKTINKYDHAGRLLEVWKTLNDNEAKKVRVAKNEYDGLGQLLKKELGDKRDQNNSYTGVPVEALDFSYNIRGWLTGINKDYAMETGASANSKWFGMQLRYDFGIEKPLYGGNIAGTNWRSKGNGIKRAYGFTYDESSRLLGADFSQHNGSAFADDAMVNFDVQTGNGLLGSNAYDQNGNLQALRQAGLKIGGSEVIDNFNYVYYPGTNKVSGITESGTGTVNHHLGDFTDKHPGGDDFGYDLNGNIVNDLNRNLEGATGAVGIAVESGGAILYNHLNLPYQVAVNNDAHAEKGTITYIYSANGVKLQKRVTEKNAAVLLGTQPYTSDVTTITTYLPGLEYQQKTYTVAELNPSFGYQKKLQTLSQEEGRIRPLYENPVDPYQITDFVYDYMIKDHLGNIRIVLTDQRPPEAIYQATMETANRDHEVALFSQVQETALSPKPEGFDTNNENQVVSELHNASGVGKKVGPGLVLKVMAGDKFKARTYAWYKTGETPVGIPVGATDIVESLINAFIGGLPAGAAHNQSQLGSGSMLNAPLGQFQTWRNSQTNTALPKAYLNWVLLDEEQFKVVEGNYGTVQIPSIITSSEKQLLQANEGGEIEVTRNGYLYVFVSNESQGSVFFDDLRVEHLRGPLLEETHYYPFGLIMAGISSKALGFGAPGNKYKYNGKEEQRQEFSDGTGLEWMDFGARQYDNQTARWMNIDPLSEKISSQTPYASMDNNPILKNDPSGMFAFPPSTEVRRNYDGTYTVVNAKNDKDNNVYVVDDKGKRTGETIAQTVNPFDFMYTNEETGEFVFDKKHSGVTFALDRLTITGSIVADGRTYSVKDADVWCLRDFASDVFQEILNERHPHTSLGVLQTLADLSQSNGPLDLKASMNHSPYTPILWSQEKGGKPTITTLRAASNLAFGSNMRDSKPGYMFPLPFYIPNMYMVGQYNQTEHGGNGYNAGYPFYGEHTYSGTYIYRGYWDEFYKNK